MESSAAHFAAHGFHGAAEQDRLAWSTNCHHMLVHDGFVRGSQYHEGTRDRALSGRLRLCARDTVPDTRGPTAAQA